MFLKHLLGIYAYADELESTSALEEATSQATTEATKSAGETASQMASQASEELSQKSNEIIDTIKSYGPKAVSFAVDVLIGLIILLIGHLIIKMILRTTKRIFDKSKLDSSVARFLQKLISVVLYIVLFISVLGTVGIKTTSFIALLSTGAVAIGLALQGALSNVAGGVLILVIKPFTIGDYIVENGSNGVEGTVDRIDIFYTHLTTIDNKNILIPNGTLINSRITNITQHEKRRIDLSVGISYQADIKKAKELLFQAGKETGDLITGESNQVNVKELAESSVVLEVRFWVPTDKYWKDYYFLNERIKELFDENGIEIPYKQLDVHLIEK